MIDPITETRKTDATKPETTPDAATEILSRKTLSRETLPQETVSQDTLADLFPDRDQDRDHSREQKLDVENPSPTTSNPQEEGRLKQEEAPQEAEDVKREEASVKLQRLQGELEKTQKRLTENQQYGRQNAQRLKTALKVVKDLETEGSLSDEESARLIDSLGRDSEEGLGLEPSYPFTKVLSIANQELENIRNYTDDATLDDKVRAFDYFLLVSSPEEREQALEDLTALKDNPLSLAKKMLSMGQQYRDQYQEMKAVGSLQGLLHKKDQDIGNLRKTLDKLTKKLSHYEDYDKPRYRLEEMGAVEANKASSDTISSLFDDRDRVKRR
jgi:hypothetical protein